MNPTLFERRPGKTGNLFIKAALGLVYLTRPRVNRVKLYDVLLDVGPSRGKSLQTL